MKDSAKYAKIVEWSDEDQPYVGSAPGLLYGGCHGSDEKKVFDELCRIVEEAIDLYKKDGKPLLPPTSGRDFSDQNAERRITMPPHISAPLNRSDAGSCLNCWKVVARYGNCGQNQNSPATKTPELARV